MRQRGVALAEEFRGKGVQSVQHMQNLSERLIFNMIAQRFLGTCDGYCALFPFIIGWF